MTKEELIKKPIAVFDSGVGGISVLRELVNVMPGEDFYYFGDSINAPYGTKPQEEVRELTIGHVRDFVNMGIKGCAIACNTATSAAVKDLRVLFPDLPLVGIEPAIKPAVELKENATILVMATPVTTNGEKFKNLLKQYENRANFIPLACPGFMEYIEQGKHKSDELRVFLEDLLKDYVGKVDAVVLGCTHYPFAKDEIAEIMGEGTEIIDGSLGTAKELKRRIDAAGLLRNDDHIGKVEFVCSLPTGEKKKLMEELLNT